MVKTMVSCRFSLKPIQWILVDPTRMLHGEPWWCFCPPAMSRWVASEVCRPRTTGPFQRFQTGRAGFLCARCSWGTHLPGFPNQNWWVRWKLMEIVSNRGVDLSMTVSCLARFLIHQRPSVASSCKFTEYLKLIAQTCQTRFLLFLGYIWQCVKTLYPCSSHKIRWDLWMFIPLKMVLIGIDP